ncbi:hypothetical protein TVAG_160980 [Trichomonas vaginalis G3]|uniref:Uncharacterized protein n=1 Tax=Trichomonas vaginalis (strain ATCC PRA-98 / G3) TaxID=412133 RepID=A2E4V3_TRIV3|nr:hypothetical protein TVAGG3_0227960 [Trichomonas vaginalis G3]EAY12292.1 hypothetical protein TVAG_160980 [Trichomonas vaginalis G3]KAI5552406.1 hypothetical protein TVAGG3_0227960 [Trichomonas vaginalis G3]|eukprot:XP_001324515.1 hypothetical protein [Trichomonas vaginalis G3]
MQEKCSFSFPACLSILYTAVGVIALALSMRLFPHKETVIDKIPFYNWNDTKWKSGNTFDELGSMQNYEVKFHGKFEDYVVYSYKVPLQETTPRYTIIKDAYLGPDGRIYKDWCGFPQEHRFITFDSVNYSTKPTRNIRYFDSAIAFPIYDILSEPCIYTLLFPILNSVPTSEIQGRRFFINRYISDIELILPKFGMNFTHQVFSQFGWVHAKDLLVLEPPQDDFLIDNTFRAFSEKIKSHKPGELFNQNKIALNVEGDDPLNKMHDIYSTLKSSSDKFENVSVPIHMLERMDIFRDFGVFVSFNSDNLHLLQFMKPNSLAIIIQSPDNFLKYIPLARAAGVRVHCISYDEVDIASTIIQILKDENVI